MYGMIADDCARIFLLAFLPGHAEGIFLKINKFQVFINISM